MVKTIGNVIFTDKLADGIYSMTIETEIALSAKPGQFVSLYTKDESKLLPRPISICQINAKDMTIRVVYRAVGAGTTEFSTYKAGDKITLMGPLGNGYPIDDINPASTVILVGGGVGVPPMVACAEELRRRYIKTIAVMGYRSDDTFLQEELSIANESYIATDDGSLGTKGTVVDAIKLNHIKGDVILACGPKPMLSAVKTHAKYTDALCYVSLEERMACGVGACLGCVCESTGIDDHSGVNNKRVCKDGPVFLADEVKL